MTRLSAGPTLVLSLAFATGASAGQVPMPQDVVLSRPANGDMNATPGPVRAAFDALDADHDGRIARGEAAGDALLAARFEALDADGDASLTRAEHDDYLALAAATDNGGE